MKEGEC